MGSTSPSPLRFETSPAAYRHWRLGIDGPVARLEMDVQEQEGHRSDYELKLNSYDIGVDIELADATRRVRFEHPEVRTLVIQSAKDRVFCSGANIFMLGTSTHAFKVNFCKFTNETRIGLEDLTAECGVHTIAALNGVCAGGGYELALACEEIILQDDGSSAVSLPETPLLGVLPGTGGLTRVVDKRKVRRDLADVYCTVAEGVKGRRAEEWNLVDAVVPASRFRAYVEDRAADASAGEGVRGRGPGARGVTLLPLEGKYDEEGVVHRHVRAKREGRLMRVVIQGPPSSPPTDPEALRATVHNDWALRTARELDDVLLDLRFNRPDIGLIVLQTEGDPTLVLEYDDFLEAYGEDWLVHEVRAYWKRALKRLDLMAKSVFTLIEPGSCFAGTLMEIALASDRAYMLDDPERPVRIVLSSLNAGVYPMGNGLSRLATRFLGDPQRVSDALAHEHPYDPAQALEAGLVTLTPDDIDWDDEVRIAIEERLSLSPDALTGMEANLRFAGPETLETKIFGRLSAWQNWIFQRPNAVGARGALTLYGRPERPEFDWTRT